MFKNPSKAPHAHPFRRTTPASATGCPPQGWTRESLLALKRAQWTIEEPARRESLATGLLDCLGEPDPVLRDAIAFEGVSAMLRADALGTPALQRMARTLQLRLASPDPDTGGFERPFLALALSEVARADRLKPFLSTDERARLVDTAARYVSSVRDYRGFDARDGWRHGVAHGADLLLQLAANSALGRAEHDRILDSVASQVAPAGEHFYIYGEGERLARPVVLVARRGTLGAADWVAWMARIATPAPFKDWQTALQTQAGLARRHNLGAFLLVLYMAVHEGQDENARRDLLPALTAAVRSLP